MYIIIALITGALVISSMIVNSRLSDKVGLFQGVFINYVVGLSLAAIFLMFNLDSRSLSPSVLKNIPVWAYVGGGLLGCTIVAMSNRIIPKIPTIYTTLLIFIGQLFMGIVIDWFVGNAVSKGTIIGGLLILGGLVYNLMVDKKKVL